VANKHDMGGILTLDYLVKMYKKHGLAHVVTDGKYVQLKKEKDLSAATEKVN